MRARRRFPDSVYTPPNTNKLPILAKALKGAATPQPKSQKLPYRVQAKPCRRRTGQASRQRFEFLRDNRETAEDLSQVAEPAWNALIGAGREASVVGTE